MKIRALFTIALVSLMGTLALPQQQSPLATLATSMQPGTWAELTTSGISTAFENTGGSSDLINSYADSFRFDPVTKCGFFLGSDHGGHPTSEPNPTYRHVKYCEATNEWSVLPNPPWVIVDATQYTDAHGYDFTTIDPLSRVLYRRPYNSSQIQRWNIDTGQWLTPLPLPEWNSGCCGAIDFFPERNTLFWARDTDEIQGFSNGAWSQQSQLNGLASTWLIAEYNPVHKMMLFVNGDQIGKVYKLGETGGLIPLANLPIQQMLYDGGGWNGNITVDPIGGDYLVFTANQRRMHVLDPISNTWDMPSNQPPSELGLGGSIMAPVPWHGVVMAVHCATGTGACKTWLYKHGVGISVPPTPDTTLPTISLITPITGSLNISAMASDNVGVVGVQFKLDGVNLGNEDTVPPYSVPWSPTFTVPGSHVLTAIARDAAGNLKTAESITFTIGNTVPAPPPPPPPPPDSPSGSLDFTSRCTAPGVVKCVGFDDPREIAGRYSQPSGLLPAYGTTRYPELDTSIKASGNSSLRMTIPPQSGADGTGSYWTNFSNDFSVQFDENQEFFVQFRQRFSPEFLNTKYLPLGTAFKQLIIGTGSTGTSAGWPGIASSCTSLEVVLVGGISRNFLQAYNACGLFVGFEEGFGQDVKLQNARPAPYCLYSQVHTSYFPPVGNCFGYAPNEWMTFQVRLKIGPRLGNKFTGSTVQIWAARDGRPSQLIHDWPSFDLHAGEATTNPKERFGQVWLTAYMTGKDPVFVAPQASIWYDELIVSRSRIADPSGAAPPPPPPPQDVCTTDPLKMSGLKWPTSRTGTRSVAWNSSTKEVVDVRYQWPIGQGQNVTFKDSRGCTVTLKK